MALPIRARLALVSGGLIALLMVGVGTFLYLRLEADLIDAVDETLQARAAAITDGLERGPVALDAIPGLGDEQFAQVLARDGEVLESSGDVSIRDLSPELARGSTGPRFLELEVLSAEGEPIPARLLLSPADDDRVLVVGVSLEDQREALSLLLALLGVGGPVAATLAGGVGWMLAGAALRPVERMRIEAEAVSASEPGRRLPVPPTRDELARLGESLNLMLDRLEDSAERERRFVGEASHELRTPLANLRTELELALRRSRTPAELETALRSAVEETDRLSRLAEDLLVLARSERGRVPVRREQVDLAPLIHGSIGEFAGQAAKAGVSVEAHVPEGLSASLDPLRMRQALRNLLDNSLRQTPPGGSIAVEAAKANGVLSLEVRDSGEGFPSTFLPKAFEPFARPAGSRSRLEGGAGLGLAIVRAVAEAHGGSAEARNRSEGGASVQILIPE